MSSMPSDFTPRQRRLIMIFSLMATTMGSLDSTIANVALPEIQGGLAIAPDQIGWILTSFMIATAIGTPLVGALVPKIGLRALFVLSVTGFMVMSLACGLATSLHQLVVFRALQGFTAAALMPLGQMVLYDIYPPEQMGRVISQYSLGTLSGAVVGPSLGGFITDAASWRWIFLVNIPVGIVTIIGLLAVLPRMPPARSRPFDYLGFGFLAVALLCLQLMLDRGQSKDWFRSTEILTELLVGLTAFYMFMAHSVTAKYPFLDFNLFKNRNFVLGMVATFILSLVSYMPSVVTPLFLQHVQGYGVLGTGLILTPRFIGMAGGMLLMSRIVDKVDQRVLVSLGLGLTLCGFASLRDLTPITPAIVLIGAGILQALGTSVTMVPLNLSTFTTISSEMRPMAMAIYNLARGTSQSLGTALTLSYISRSTEDNHVRLLQQISVYNPVMTGSMPAEWSLTNPLSLKLLSLEVWRQASVIAYDNVFSIACLSSIACFPIVLILRKKAQGEYHKSAPEDRQESADALDIVHAG